jgi:uncharacterized membrane protein
MLLFTAILLPFAASPASASADIDVTLSSQHQYLVPGTAVNVTVDVTNDNVMSTRSFDLSLDTTYLPSYWNVTLADSTLGPIFPTQSSSTTLVVRLDPGAPLGANGQVDVTATRSDDANESTTVTLQLSVAPLYLPALDLSLVGNNGLIVIEPNQTVDVQVPVENQGNIDDTIILQVDGISDLAEFWSNWNSSQSSNNTNGTGNGTGNNTGNGTGNGTGNNTGNGTGNGTGGNNGTGNNTGNGTGNNTGNGSAGNGTSMRGPARDLPPDWEVRWLDPVAENMTSGETRNHTLRLTVPPDATPQYRGIALFAGSTGGNFSIQYVIVIEVSTISDVVFNVVDDANRTYLPGVTEVVSFEVSNNGNDVTTLVYQTTTDSTCSASLASSVGSELAPLASEFISINITPEATTHWNDTCTISLFATENSTGVIHESSHTITVGVVWGWEITPPNGTTISPGTSKTIQVGVRNIGSEIDEVRFDLTGPSGITATGPPTWVSVERGLSDVISFQVDVLADTSLVGLYNLTLTATGLHGGEVEIESIEVDVQTRIELDLVAPQGGNVFVTAGDYSGFSIQATNSGTNSLSFNFDWSGLPNSLSFSGVPTVSNVNVGESLMIPFNVSATSSAIATTHQITLYAKSVNGSDVISQTTFSIEVGHSPSVQILASGDTLPVGENTVSSMQFVILNDGNQQDQFSFSLSPSTDGFEVTISPLLLSLNAGEQDIVTVSIRRTTAIGEATLALVAASSNDDSITDSYSFTVTEVVLGVTAILTSTETTAAIGDTVQAYLWLTNTGNANQTFQLATSGLDCSNAQSIISLEPSASAVPILLECLVPQGTPAGVISLSATITSLADTSINATSAVNLTVPVDQVNGQPRLIVTVSSSEQNILPYQGSLVLTVLLQNEGNEQLTGTLSLVGEGAADLSPGWTAVGGSSNPNYNLGPGESASYDLLLTSLYTTSGGELSMRVQGAGPGHQLLSDPFTLNIIGPTAAPDGVSFGLFELDNQKSITIMAVGWLTTSLFVLLAISKRRRAKKDNIRSTFFETDETTGELAALTMDGDLPPPPAAVVSANAPADKADDGEVKMVDGRVNCPGCASSLKMPEGRQPPFKFTCPKCQESVRVVD